MILKKRALLVNDSRFESLILKDMLNKLDYDVEIADEFDALYEVEQFEPDIVIVNYIMQKTRGDKLIQLIKAGMPDIKCLLSSSNSIKANEFKQDHVDGVLHTPLSLYTLKDTLKRIGEMEELLQYIEKENAKVREENVQYCPYCAKNVSKFNMNIAFCPYCGESLRESI